MALELALSVGKEGILAGDRLGEKRKRLGSAISVCGPLLSFPSTSLGIATPIAYFTRQSPQAAIAKKVKNSLDRAFREVEVVHGGQAAGEGMPRGKEEWRGIMAFWGRVLGKDEGWKGDGEVYEVVR